MTEVIKWEEIVAECDDYRAGYVDTFRRYQGKPTDEKDRQGRTVKVTVSSFARHMKIPKATFQTWVKQGGGRGPLAARHAGRDERGAKAALRDPEQRRTVIEGLTEKERIDLATDAWEAAHDAAAARREHEPEEKPERSRDPVVRVARWELVRATLRKVEDDLLDAIRSAEAMDWDADTTERAMDRIARVEQRLDLLKVAIRKDEPIDWDAELAKETNS